MYFYIFVIFLLTSCSSSDKVLQNNATLHNVTLSSPDKSTSTYYSGQGTYSSSLVAVNAVAAWDYIRYNITANTPGQGMKVLVIDTAVAPDHSAFYNSSNGQSQISTIQVGDVYDTNTNFNQLTGVSTTQSARNASGQLSAELNEVAMHGTAVASLIVGNVTSITNGSSTVKTAGVAFGATVGVLQMAQKVQGQTWSLSNQNLDGLNWLYSDTNRLSNIIQQNNYHIVNLSYGDSNNISIEDASIQAAVQNNNVLIVAATGNNDPESSRFINPEYPAALAQIDNAGSYQGGILAVTSTNTATGVSSTETFNYCGNAKAFCLAAPSSNVTVATPDKLYSTDSGTSFSTPIVAGICGV